MHTLDLTRHSTRAGVLGGGTWGEGLGLAPWLLAGAAAAAAATTSWWWVGGVRGCPDGGWPPHISYTETGGRDFGGVF